MIKAQKHGKLGLTIIEVMVSIALLAIGVITFAAIQSFLPTIQKIGLYMDVLQLYLQAV
jgi:prepilin-type N-terminal cleavage/methylation domain